MGYLILSLIFYDRKCFDVLQGLKDALTNLFKDGIENPFYRPVTTFVLNPKVCTVSLKVNFHSVLYFKVSLISQRFT